MYLYLDKPKRIKLTFVETNITAVINKDRQILIYLILI